jgi:hypothetical protein
MAIGMARRMGRGALMAGAVLVVGLLAGSAIAAGATSGGHGSSGPEGGGDRTLGAVMASGNGVDSSGPFHQELGGSPAASWGSFFASGLTELGGPTATTVDPSAQNVLPRAGWIGRLHVRNAAPTPAQAGLAGPVRFTVFVNGSPTSVSCVIDAGGDACTTGWQQSYARAGDLIAIQMTVLSPTDVDLYATSWSVTFT